ncbi:hypothetical protein [Sphingomonas sp. PR090111-T3T-6A]|uniref:hypothetical protein n=1 Tax=Sphingomonas sp. PR090111-T3T-6A TaxID=685778 RepID=UPI00037EE641|nr:hypothetical protein [Sphingomonas sp. PR090111-T3T-6A]
MIVKVGDQWFGADINQPIMVVLSDEDKANIANMPQSARHYAEFHDDHAIWASAKIAWMIDDCPCSGCVRDREAKPGRPTR